MFGCNEMIHWGVHVCLRLSACSSCLHTCCMNCSVYVCVHVCVCALRYITVWLPREAVNLSLPQRLLATSQGCMSSVNNVYHYMQMSAATPPPPPSSPQRAHSLALRRFPSGSNPIPQITGLFPSFLRYVAVNHRFGFSPKTSF